MVEEKVSSLTKDALAKMPAPQPHVPSLTAAEVRKIAEDIVAKMAKDIVAIIPPAQPQVSPDTLRMMIAEEVASKTSGALEQSPAGQASALSASDMWSAAEDAVRKVAQEYFDRQPSAQTTQIPDEVLRSMVDAKVSSMTKETLEQMPASRTSAFSPSDMWSVADEAVEKIAREFLEKQSLTQVPERSDETLRRMVEQVAARTVDEALEKRAISHPASMPSSELRKMAEDTVSRMALEIFSDMTPPIPKISEDTVRKGIEEAVMVIARDVAREVIEKVAWETVPRLAEVMIKEEIERLKAME
jgi:hypothetical protein